MGAGRNQVPVEFGEHRLEGVGVGEGVFVAVGLLDNQVVEEGLEFHVQDGFVKTGVAQLDEVEFHLAVAGLAPHKGRLGLVGADDRLDTLVGFQRVDAQHREGVTAVKIPNGQHLVAGQRGKIVPIHKNSFYSL